jgi:hypothetical protein
MVSIEHNKEVEGNLAEICVKASSFEVRIFTNFLQPKQLLSTVKDLFIHHTKHKQLTNKKITFCEV